MKRKSRVALRHVEEGVVAVFFTVMVLAVGWAVFSRYVLADPVAWADLVARLCFTWVTFVGAAIAVKHGADIRIDFFVGLLPERARSGVRFVVHGLTALLLAGLVIKGFSFAWGTWPQKVPPLDFSYGYFALAVPVSALSMLAHVVRAMGGGLARPSNAEGR